MTQTADPQPSVPATGLAPELAPSPPEKGWTRRAQAAIDERLGIDALRYPVPAHANKVGYSLGAPHRQQRVPRPIRPRRALLGRRGDVRARHPAPAARLLHRLLQTTP